uniref:Epidermal differentiation-specific protein-like n=1 Tax=Geotrypetes seraphini TaxID=260995 RepID=A0A6P8PJM9_GEOSA|nr:epidermal differentiation-specific protein-like [Geotrypetes seraphini]
MKPNKIIVYEKPEFKGLSREFISDIKDLKDIGFDDCISSLKVIGQPWIAYEHSNFGGWLQEYEEGEYPKVDKENRFSSLCLITEDLANPRITLYEHANFKGKSKTFTMETNMTYDNFNNMASSHFVDRGAWIILGKSAWNFAQKGNRVLARAGESFADYNKIGLDDKVYYIRPLKAGLPFVTAKVLWDQEKKINETFSSMNDFNLENIFDSEQEFIISRSIEHEFSTTYEIKFTNCTTLEVGASFDLKLIASLNANISNCFTVEKGKTESVTQNDTVEITVPIKLPPHTKMTFRMMKEECTTIVPVELTIELNGKETVEFAELRCLKKSITCKPNEPKKI